MKSIRYALHASWSRRQLLVMLCAVGCGGPARDSSVQSKDTTMSTAAASPARTESLTTAAPSAQPAPKSSQKPASAATIASTPSANERSSRRVTVQGVDLTGVGYDRGSESAPIVLVDFSDFACPYCRSFSVETEPTIERDYVKTGKVFFKYVPFVVGSFPNGQQAARTAECAAEQGMFWPMYERVYAHQKTWKDTLYALPVFQRDAAALALDTARFTQCYTTNRLHPRSKEATNAADALRIRVTPSFFMNGRLIEGALPIEQFRELLDAALRDAR